MDTHTYFGLCADHDWEFFRNYFNSDNKEQSLNGEEESNTLLYHYRKCSVCRDIYDAWYTFKIINKGEGIKPNFDDFIGDVYEGVENSNGC